MCKQLRIFFSCWVDVAVMMVNDGLQTGTEKNKQTKKKNLMEIFLLCVINSTRKGTETMFFPHNLSHHAFFSHLQQLWSFLFFFLLFSVWITETPNLLWPWAKYPRNCMWNSWSCKYTVLLCSALFTFCGLKKKKEMSLWQLFTLSNTSVSALKCICELSSSIEILSVYCMA